MKHKYICCCRYRFYFLPLLITALVALCVALTSCSTDHGSDQQGESAPVKVTYRLKWLFNASAAGDIWADRMGFFKKAGLAVELKEGGAEQDAITDIEMGRALFGTASADQVIRARSKGADIMVTAQIFQQNPLQWIYCSESTPAINAPSDLRGLTVGITYGGNDEAIFMALMKKYHLTEDDVNLYAVHYDYAPFWKGKVNLWPVYRNTEGIVLSRKMAAGHRTAAFFEPGRYGINFVANSIITSRATYMERPDLIKKFTKALIDAWTDALSEKNRRKAAREVHSVDPDTPVAVIMEQLASTKEFILPANAVPGAIDRKAWEQTCAIMLDQKLIEHYVAISEILDPKHYVSP